MVLAEHTTTITKGTTPTSLGFTFEDSGVPFVRVQNIEGGTISFGNDALFVSQSTHNALRRSKIYPNDLLISIAGTIGRAGIVPHDFPEMNCNQAVAIVRPHENMDRRYLLHWLSSEDAMKQIRQSKVTATIPNLSLGQIGALKIPLPPLPEQRRIAGILDQADALRRLRRQSLSRLADLGQAIFYEMFGEPAANPKGWKKVNLVECVTSSDDIRCGPFGTQLLREEFQESGIPLWGIKQVNRSFSIPTHEYVTQKKAAELTNYSILPGDIVMTRKGTIGNCSVYPQDYPEGIMHSDLLRLRLDRKKCEPEFISDQLHFSQDVQHQIALISGGAIMQGINVGRLKQIKVLWLPKTSQEEYVRRVNAVQSKRSTACGHEHALDFLFASLQHRAFRGEL